MTTFDQLMSEVTPGGHGFGHRQHVQLTYLAITRVGLEPARALVADGIRETATAAGVPQKFHATMTGAWLELVGHHVTEEPGASFEELVSHNPALLDKALLSRFYEDTTLASDAARAAWTEPDRAPFPWDA